jgi:hypothetical protein
MDDLQQRYLALPCPTHGKEDFKLWSEWIDQVFKHRRYALLGLHNADNPDDRRRTSWRACLAHWARSLGEKNLTISPEHSVKAALAFLKAAHAAPAYVERAARLLVEDRMYAGV